ncbi:MULTISPECIES: 4-fold beta flower protein [Gammaproteobacteria]|uniref:4-fold beta flower protein n=1 Tax=Gammaproteobacteria TaxID=1236 RepID=UPI0013729D74|nr:hypothetical protein [Vibrio sp. V39_P1S14PM300]NAX23375.1 hypothetical protein [Vibrio sp. V39_P1S14PM300]
MANHFFKWNGQHLGFERNGRLFDPQSQYLGWIEEDGSVWSAEGVYVGEVVNGQYILRNTNKMQPMNKMAKMPPMPPLPPLPPLPKLPKLPKLGWHDPFDV